MIKKLAKSNYFIQNLSVSGKMKTKLDEKVQKEKPDGDEGLKKKKKKKPKKNEDTLDGETKVETVPPKKKLEKRKIQNEDPEGEEISKKKLKKIQQDSTDDDSEAEQKKNNEKKNEKLRKSDGRPRTRTNGFCWEFTIEHYSKRS